jgi:hypothetical protein
LNISRANNWPRGSMDYYQSVVVEYLRADRAVFANTEYCIQINPGSNPDTSGPHWYCDAVALNFRSKEIFLCEISYAKHLSDLTKRLKDWQDNWDGVRKALARESCFSEPWPIRPWLFIPQDRAPLLQQRLIKIADGQSLKFNPRVTHLEEVQPWLYQSWSRKDKKAEEPCLP